MSAKSKPSTGVQAELSKISETSSRALMVSNLTRPAPSGSAELRQDRADPVDQRHVADDGQRWLGWLRLWLGFGLGLRLLRGGLSGLAGLPRRARLSGGARLPGGAGAAGA